MGFRVRRAWYKGLPFVSIVILFWGYRLGPFVSKWLKTKTRNYNGDYRQDLNLNPHLKSYGRKPSTKSLRTQELRSAIDASEAEGIYFQALRLQWGTPKYEHDFKP